MLIMARQWFTIGDDFEAAARRAVDEEAGQWARMEADSAVARRGSVAWEVTAERLVLIQEQVAELAPPLGEVEGPDVEARLVLIQEHAQAIDDLHRELVARLEVIEWQDRALREFRTVLVLLRETRVYRAMLALGRWRWLDRRIRRALRM